MRLFGYKKTGLAIVKDPTKVHLASRCLGFPPVAPGPMGGNLKVTQGDSTWLSPKIALTNIDQQRPVWKIHFFPDVIGLSGSTNYLLSHYLFCRMCMCIMLLE